MKKLLKFLFILFLGTLITGFYLKSKQNPKADFIIGLSVLLMSFVLMPLFIYYRYSDGKYKKYILKNKEEDTQEKSS